MLASPSVVYMLHTRRNGLMTVPEGEPCLKLSSL